MRNMRKQMAVAAVIASCMLMARVTAAGDYEHWTDRERAEHEARVIEPCPAPPPCPAAPAVAVAAPSREVYWRTGADEYDDSQANPLRILAYLLHPVGYTLEWLATRPFHEVVAQPDLEPIFGHDEHAYYGEQPFGVSGSREVRD